MANWLKNGGKIAGTPVALRTGMDSTRYTERPQRRREHSTMRNHTETKNPRIPQNSACRFAAALFLALSFAASTGFAEETDATQQQQCGQDWSAKELSVVRPVTVNPEEVEMLRRLLGLAAAPAQTLPGPASAGEPIAG
ncbi:MAG: hypothetical protein HY899_06860 [Deltaproteobacteria bacterium]|nr:hypothetical protein [Deltaproteobacteria bacterium]